MTHPRMNQPMNAAQALEKDIWDAVLIAKTRDVDSIVKSLCAKGWSLVLGSEWSVRMSVERVLAP